MSIWINNVDLGPEGNGAHREVNAQTATSYTFALSDTDKMVTFNSSSTTNATVPTNANAPFPLNIEIDIVRLGSGSVTIVAASGVTINSPAGALSIGDQYGGATLKKLDTNTWILVGDLA